MIFKICKVSKRLKMININNLIFKYSNVFFFSYIFLSYFILIRTFPTYIIYFFQICYYCHGSDGSAFGSLPRSNFKSFCWKFLKDGTKAFRINWSTIANPSNTIGIKFNNMYINFLIIIIKLEELTRLIQRTLLFMVEKYRKKVEKYRTITLQLQLPS